MNKRKKTIITNNREIYHKFNMLNFSSEVILENVKEIQVKKILKNINKQGSILNMEKLGDYIIVRRVNPLNFKIYIKNKKS